MTRKINGVAVNNPKNTIDRLTGNQKAFSVSDYAEIQGKLQSNLLAIMKPAKVVRLHHRCFYCEKSYTRKMMSSAGVICKACYAAATEEGKSDTARNNFIEKTLNNVHKFLRSRVSV